MATHSSILAWEIPRTEEPGGLLTMGLKESDTTEQLTKLIYNIVFISGTAQWLYIYIIYS